MDRIGSVGLYFASWIPVGESPSGLRAFAADLNPRESKTNRDVIVVSRRNREVSVCKRLDRCKTFCLGGEKESVLRWREDLQKVTRKCQKVLESAGKRKTVGAQPGNNIGGRNRYQANDRPKAFRSMLEETCRGQANADELW